MINVRGRGAFSSQGGSRITERSPVTGFSQTSPIFIGLRSGAAFGSGCDMGEHRHPALVEQFAVLERADDFGGREGIRTPGLLIANSGKII
jgi:hypothetical protein